MAQDSPKTGVTIKRGVGSKAHFGQKCEWQPRPWPGALKPRKQIDDSILGVTLKEIWPKRHFHEVLESMDEALIERDAGGVFCMSTQPVIGLTGSFGSGCSYIAKEILEGQLGYKRFSLTEVLKKDFEATHSKKADQATRRELQDHGDTMRHDKGASVLADKVYSQIEEHKKTAKTGQNYVVDSIRNPAEIRALRGNFHDTFFLFGISAATEIRWKRVQNKYRLNRQQFNDDDKNDTGNASALHGQRVGDCFYEADVVLENEKNFAVKGNDDFKKLLGTVKEYVALLENPLTRSRPIREEEALMATAYAISQRSSCIKRKVGAVIVDAFGNIISSGFNEVPRDEKPCSAEYGKCYRDHLFNEHFGAIPPELVLPDKVLELRKWFRDRFKILDRCRALHAEEIAILNLIRNGKAPDLKECTLYTTTYPCKPCAQKIASVGIGRMRYLEPYPDPDSMVILENANVESRHFQGVTFRAYFRVYGEEK